MLQQHGGRECIHIALPAAGRSTHFADGALCGSGGESFVDQSDWQSAPLSQKAGHAARFGTAISFVAVAIEGKAHHEPFGAQHLGPLQDFTHGWSLAGAAHDVPHRRRDGTRRVTDGEADPAITQIDGEHTQDGWGEGGEAGFAYFVINWKKSRLVLDFFICLTRKLMASSAGMSARKVRRRKMRFRSS